MTSFEEKKKIWEAEKAERIARRIAKAEAWRSKLEQRIEKRREKSGERITEKEEVAPIVVEYTKKVKAIPAVKVVQPKKARQIKKSGKAKTKRKLVIPKPKIVSKPKKIVVYVKKKPRAKKKKEKLKPKKSEIKKKIKIARKKPKSLKPIAGFIESILKEAPVPLTPIQAIEKEEKVKEEISAPKEEVVEKEKPQTIKISGLFTDIFIPQQSGESGLGLGSERFKELEEKLKRLRRF